MDKIYIVPLLTVAVIVLLLAVRAWYRAWATSTGVQTGREVISALVSDAQVLRDMSQTRATPEEIQRVYSGYRDSLDPAPL